LFHKKKKIEYITLSKVSFGDRHLEVKHELILSMIDGKVCNAITHTTSTQKRYLCGSTKDFKDIDRMINTIVTENLHYGILVLNGWVRFFECL